MKKTLVTIILGVLLSSAYGQSNDRIKSVIESDYLSALLGIQELSSEMRSTKDKAMVKELNQAKKSLIADYTNGSYALFAKGAMIEVGKSSKTNKYIKNGMSSYLNKYASKKYKTASIKVNNITPMDKSNWYKVEYTSRGEVSSSAAKREAVVAYNNGQYSIRSLSYADRPITKAKNEDVAAVPKVAKPKKKQVVPAAPKPKEKEVIVPSFSAMAAANRGNEVFLSGEIVNPIAGATLTAYLDGTFINGVRLNEKTGAYSFTLTADQLHTSSVDVSLHYEYGSGKFIKGRKNIVLFAPVVSHDIVNNQEED